MKRGPVKRGKAVTEDKRQDFPAKLRKLAMWMRANDLDMQAPPDTVDPDNAAKAFEALQQRVADLERSETATQALYQSWHNRALKAEQRVGEREALLERLDIYMSDDDLWGGGWINYPEMPSLSPSELVRQALRSEPDECGGGDDPDEGLPKQVDVKRDPEGLAKRLAEIRVHPEQAQEGECPHGCSNGLIWITDIGIGPRPCPIHGTAKETD